MVVVLLSLTFLRIRWEDKFKYSNEIENCSSRLTPVSGVGKVMWAARSILLQAQELTILCMASDILGTLCADWWTVNPHPSSIGIKNNTPCRRCSFPPWSPTRNQTIFRQDSEIILLNWTQNACYNNNVNCQAFIRNQYIIEYTQPRWAINISSVNFK